MLLSVHPLHHLNQEPCERILFALPHHAVTHYKVSNKVSNWRIWVYELGTSFLLCCCKLESKHVYSFCVEPSLSVQLGILGTGIMCIR